MRILLAEDDQVLADGLCRSLRGRRIRCRPRRQRQRGRRRARRQCEYDLLILDLGLPAMAGLDVLKRLRSAQRGCRC
jgi:two-component system OmpR family response regulator